MRALMFGRSHVRTVVLAVAVLAAVPHCSQPRKIVPSERPAVEASAQADRLESLRRQASLASPPIEEGSFLEPELVDLSRSQAAFKFDIRYATENNFMGAPMYTRPGAWLQQPAARALEAAARELSRQGLGLLIFDAYRPWSVTWLFWEATPVEKRDYVADPARGSRHNRGCAVDLTLYDLGTRRPLPMPSGYDDFSERAHQDYTGGTEEERRNRKILRQAMEQQGFQVYPYEWWHFDYRDWRRYPILNLSFEELGQAREN